MKDLIPKTRAQIAEEYGISRRTLYTWLKEEGIELKRRLVLPKEQTQIYSAFGQPPNLQN